MLHRASSGFVLKERVTKDIKQLELLLAPKTIAFIILKVVFKKVMNENMPVNLKPKETSSNRQPLGLVEMSCQMPYFLNLKTSLCNETSWEIKNI